MAPPKKRPARRQRRNRTDIGLVEAVAPQVPAPPPDRAWLKGTRERWAGFWRSDLSSVVEADTDTAALRRLFTYYDELDRATRAVRRERFVEGSQGQPRLNPAAKYVLELEGSVRALEDRFGLTPKARLQLGVEFATAQRTLKRMNADLEVDGGPDPRLEVA
jgi:P27 family predicted phage terminase small subunit